LKNSGQPNARVSEKKREPDEFLLEQEVLNRTYQFIIDISHEIQTSAEYVTYNLKFLRDAQHEVDTLFKNWGQMIHALRSKNWNNISIDEVQAEKSLTVFSEISAELPHAISDSLMGIKEISKFIKLLEFLHPDHHYPPTKQSKIQNKSKNHSIRTSHTYLLLSISTQTCN